MSCPVCSAPALVWAVRETRERDERRVDYHCSVGHRWSVVERRPAPPKHVPFPH